LNVRYQERTEKSAYDDIDSSRLEQLRQSFQKTEKEGVYKEPLQEGAKEDDTEELTALVASLQKLFTHDNNDNVNDDKNTGAITNAFSDIMDEIKAGALSSKDSLDKNAIDKLTELLGNVDSLEGMSGENGKNLVAMLTSLMNVLKTGADNNSLDNETQKLETVRALSEQLLKLIDQMLGKGKFSENNGKADTNRSIKAILELVVNRTNMLIKQGTEEQLNAQNKEGIRDKIKETIEAILSMSNQDSEDELKSTIEQLVAGLFSNADNQKNQSALTDILNKYGLTAADNLNSSNEMDLDELKERLTNVLMLMAKDVKAEKANTSGWNGKSNTIDKFAKILEENMNSSNVATKSGNTDATNDNNSAKAIEGKEEKLLNSILGKEDKETDSKTEKVNNFISQWNNSKDEINSEKIIDKPVITKSNFTQDIIKTVKYMNLNNLKELTVKITPKELGEITIKITMTDGNIKANISANNKEAFNLLSSNLKEITTSLGNNDIKIQETNINIYQEDASLMRDSSNKNGAGQFNRNKNKNSNQNEVTGISEMNEGITEDDSNISILV
jgi:flagellar hook-length control protein FliK